MMSVAVEVAVCAKNEVLFFKDECLETFTFDEPIRVVEDTAVDLRLDNSVPLPPPSLLLELLFSMSYLLYSFVADGARF